MLNKIDNHKSLRANYPVKPNLQPFPTEIKLHSFMFKKHAAYLQYEH